MHVHLKNFFIYCYCYFIIVAAAVVVVALVLLPMLKKTQIRKDILCRHTDVLNQEFSSMT